MAAPEPLPPFDPYKTIHDRPLIILTVADNPSDASQFSITMSVREGVDPLHPVIAAFQSAFSLENTDHTQRCTIASQCFSQAEDFRKECNYEKSLDSYRIALKLYRELHNSQPHIKVLVCLSRLGDVLERLGQLPEALKSYEECYEMHKELYKTNDKLDLASHLQDIGTVLQKLGCFVQAAMKFEEALKLCQQECGTLDSANVAYALKGFAKALCDLGCYEKALSCLDDALSMAKRLFQVSKKAAKKSKQPAGLVIDILCVKEHVVAQLKRYPEALAVCEEALQRQKELHDHKPHSEIVGSLKCAGSLLEVLERYPEAIARHQAALEMLDVLSDRDYRLNIANTLDLMGIAFQGNNNFQSALECHVKALTMLKAIFGEELPNEHIALCLNYLAITFGRLSQPEEALRHYVKASEMTNQLMVPGAHPLNAVTLSSIGVRVQTSTRVPELYFTSQEALKVLSGNTSVSLSQAQWQADDIPTLMKTMPQYAEQLITKLQHKTSHDDQLMLASIQIYKAFGLYLRSRGNLAEAKSCLEQTLQMYKLYYNFPSDQKEIPDCLACIAGVLRDLGNLKEAKSALEVATQMQTRLCFPDESEQTLSVEKIKQQKEAAAKDFTRLIDYSHLATYLDNLGNLLREFGSFKEAKTQIVLALQIRNIFFPENHENNILSLNSLGNLLREMGDYNAALENHQRALDLAGPNYYTLQCLGLVHLDLGNTDVAIRRFKEALNLLYHKLPSAGREIVESLENIGHGYGYLGKYHEALKLQTLACKARENYFGKNNYLIAASLCNIALYQDRIGSYDKELATLEQALVIQRQFYGEDHCIVASTLDNKGSCLSKLGRHPEALTLHQQALKTRIAVFGEQHPLVAVSYDNLALCSSCLGDYERAHQYFLKALAIRMQIYGKEHPLLDLSKSYIETCDKALKRSSESISPQNAPDGCLITKEEFEYLIRYAREYLYALQKDSIVTLEKNPTGFVRLRLPVPKEFSARIETLRLNFWIPEVKITMVEAPHNHPRYFESMIIRGGYSHHLYEETPAATSQISHIVSRIFKSNQVDKRTIFPLGKIHLKSKGTVDVKKGTMAAFPRSLIHEVISTIQGTMSINCVLKNDNNRNHYDIFIPLNSQQDPQADRDSLISDEVNAILFNMKQVLDEWMHAQRI